MNKNFWNSLTKASIMEAGKGTMFRFLHMIVDYNRISYLKQEEIKFGHTSFRKKMDTRRALRRNGLYYSSSWALQKLRG